MAKLPPTSFTQDDFIIEKKTHLHRGFCPVDRYELKYKHFDGSFGEVQSREFIQKPLAIGILPYDTKLHQIVLIEQFRIGAILQHPAPWLIEIVAGIMDKDDESPEELIRREMQEEAGLAVVSILPIYNYFTSPGYSTEKIELFCAKVDSTKAPKFSGLKSEGEDIKIHVIPVQEAFDAIKSGRINNSMAIIALQWLELNLAHIDHLFA